MNKSKLKRLHPMAPSLIILKSKDTPNSVFLRSALNMIEHSPESLTDKWIKDINNWCEEMLTSMALDEKSNIKIGSRVRITNATVIKRRAKTYPQFPAIIVKDSDGWKYWMISPNAFNFKVGEKVTITGSVRDIKDGMVFLTRPSSVNIFR